MLNTSRPVVFTDLDGTLLDHDTYSWHAAAPALDRLRGLGIPLILASSKTGAEILTIQHDLGVPQYPAIVENGAGVIGLSPVTATVPATYPLLRDVLNTLAPGLRDGFEGFADMDDARVAELTGLSAHAARLARQRQFTEPGLWSGSAGDLPVFIAELARAGVSARQGGRFLTLSFGRTKADAMSEVMTHLGADMSVALGDAPNDVEMIESADIGIIISNPHREPLAPLAGEAEGRIRRSTEAGPAGWNHEVLDMLSSLHITTVPT